MLTKIMATYTHTHYKRRDMQQIIFPLSGGNKLSVIMGRWCYSSPSEDGFAKAQLDDYVEVEVSALNQEGILFRHEGLNYEENTHLLPYCSLNDLEKILTQYGEKK